MIDGKGFGIILSGVKLDFDKFNSFKPVNARIVGITFDISDFVINVCDKSNEDIVANIARCSSRLVLIMKWRR